MHLRGRCWCRPLARKRWMSSLRGPVHEDLGEGATLQHAVDCVTPLGLGSRGLVEPEPIIVHHQCQQGVLVWGEVRPRHGRRLAPPSDIGVIDTMIGFRTRISPSTTSSASSSRMASRPTSSSGRVHLRTCRRLYGAEADLIEVPSVRWTLRHRVADRMEGEQSQRALTEHPDRFILQANVDPMT